MGTRLLIICISICTLANGLQLHNGTTIGSPLLNSKERNRRLIPYMTFYLGNNQQYSSVPTKGNRYYSYQPQQYAVPVLPQYAPRPVNYQMRYLQSSPLSKMITQNYLALSKQTNPSLQTRLNHYQPQYVQPHYKQEQEVQYKQQIQQEEPNVQYTTPEKFVPLDVQYKQEIQEPVNAQYKTPEKYVPQEVQYKQIHQNAAIQYKQPSQEQYEEQTVRYKPQLSDIEYKNEPKIHYKPVRLQPNPFKTSHINYGQSTQYSLAPTEHYDRHQDSYQQGLSENTKESQVVQPQSYNDQKKIFIVRPQYRPTDDAVTIMQSQEINITPLPPQKYHSNYQVKPTYAPISYQEQEDFDKDQLEDNIDKNFNDILNGVSISKSLPEKITHENIDSSIKTLSKLLRILQRANALPQSAKELVRNFPKPVEPGYSAKLTKKLPPKDDEGSTPGRAGVDYPAYDEIPPTSFSCKTQRYKGFFGDPDTGCQVWHYCDLNGGQASFLCPNGTIFSQVALTCDWWFNVKCESTTQLYVLNERLYKYILPHKPKFPEDYSGPLVDHYLSLKFDEKEEKKRNETENATEEDALDEEEEEEAELPYSLDDALQNKVRSIKQIVLKP